MSHPNWPEALTRFEREGWQVQMQDARQRRQGDAGPPGWRRRFSNAAKLVNLSIVLTRNEKGAFDKFYAETCKQGSLLFWMPDPTTDGWPLLTSSGEPLLTSDGTPILLAARWLCSFGDQTPVETIAEQVKFRKSFNIVVMP
ncbi:hypothetical protein M3484_05060 [Pseudomonas sp. GX19020]|uniref:hypothetical protein n=1 Tax=Pseudomonas sp. GX19020 TaxID=2942277 RepID=UPI00201951A4|nr:hypothetical protein [Pseudomonas sp. GX19020]MCL4065931.1 hypothetical protein [Pseudomonas sp. GX19020]